MRFWTSSLGLLSLFLLPLGVESVSKRDPFSTLPIADCPENTVCVHFVNDQCTVDGVLNEDENQAVIWDKFATSGCKHKHYKSVYTLLALQLNNLTTWTVLVIQNPDKIPKIEDIEFSFAHSSLKFTDRETAEFSWTSNEKKKTESIKMKGGTLEPGNDLWRSWRPLSTSLFNGYEFTITAEGEKLINLIGGNEVSLISKNDPKRITLKSLHFVQALENLTTCDISETKMLEGEECYGECDKIGYKGTTIPLECSSKLWFHTPSEAGLMRQWQEVDNITCHMGSWQAEWGKESPRVLGASQEVQCSKEKPSSPTVALKALLGCVIGGFLLLIIALLAFFIIRYSKRNMDKASNSKSKGGTFSTSIAATPTHNKSSYL